jgi:cytosolic carboxypeptidase protein 2/3
MARVHPGETVSSFMTEGIIDWLLSEEATPVRANFVIKIIPMLNPDGVIHGNYRCSLAGCDLNRRWENPSKEIHPEIYFAKQLIIEFDKICSVALIIDLHGHNLKRSAFLYGCHKPGL